jgi:hypothetical protein
MSTFFMKRYPLGSSSTLSLLRGFHSPRTSGNSPNRLRLLFLTNSSMLSLSVLSCFVHEASSALSGMSIPPPSRISRMRLRKPGPYAKPVPSIIMAVTPYKEIKEKVTREKKMARKSRTGKRLPMELVTRMVAAIPLNPRPHQSTHPFFPMPQNPSSHSCSSSAPLLIFKMPSSWSRRGS